MGSNNMHKRSRSSAHRKLRSHTSSPRSASRTYTLDIETVMHKCADPNCEALIDENLIVCSRHSFDPNKPIRHPVEFDYGGLNLVFLKKLAMIPVYASKKYGSWSQYTAARLEGEKSPLNHIYEHLRQYQMGEAYDHFDKHPTWHLVAVAYNAMMEFFYHMKFGFKAHPLHPVVLSDSCLTKDNTSETHTDDSHRVALLFQRDLQNSANGRAAKSKAKKRHLAKPSRKQKRARGRTNSRKG
jgi:hypothetical protein